MGYDCQIRCVLYLGVLMGLGWERELKEHFYPVCSCRRWYSVSQAHWPELSLFCCRGTVHHLSLVMASIWYSSMYHERETERDSERLFLVSNVVFTFCNVKARREEQIKAAHDEAMFGVSSLPPSINTESEPEMEDNKKESTENGVASSLLSEKVHNFACF